MTHLDGEDLHPHPDDVQPAVGVRRQHGVVVAAGARPRDVEPTQQFGGAEPPRPRAASVPGVQQGGDRDPRAAVLRHPENPRCGIGIGHPPAHEPQGEGRREQGGQQQSGPRSVHVPVLPTLDGPVGTYPQR